MAPSFQDQEPPENPERFMVQLAWRFLLFQKDSALAQWYRARTADARGGTRKTLIVALARKLLIALYQVAV
jgi:transposase